MSYENMMQAFKAVEENNRMNNGTWQDWEDVGQIIETYEIGDLTAEERDVLAKAIAGEDVLADLEKMEFAEWGVNFSNGKVERAAESVKKSVAQPQ